MSASSPLHPPRSHHTTTCRDPHATSVHRATRTWMNAHRVPQRSPPRQKSLTPPMCIYYLSTRPHSPSHPLAQVRNTQELLIDGPCPDIRLRATYQDDSECAARPAALHRELLHRELGVAECTPQAEVVFEATIAHADLVTFARCNVARPRTSGAPLARPALLQRAARSPRDARRAMLATLRSPRHLIAT